MRGSPLWFFFEMIRSSLTSSQFLFTTLFSSMDTPGRFLSPNNLRIVLSQTVIVAVGAIGMTLIIISGGIDLAVVSTFALNDIITALGIHAGFTPVVALGGGIFVGGLVGVGYR